MERLYRKIRQDWEDICTKYVNAFIKKHNIEDDSWYWVGNNPGTILCICDYFISMDDLRYDIDNNIPEEKFDEWYWKSIDSSFQNKSLINYPSFCKGLVEELKDKKRKRKNAEVSCKGAYDTFIKELSNFPN